METVPATRMRWSVWARGMGGEALVLWARDEVFPLFTAMAGRFGANFMTVARRVIDELDSLKPGGRCALIVPEGVLFGSTGVHKELRRLLVVSNTVEAVLSLPGGVFPATERVLFLHADADGYKLDANHDNTDRDRRSAGASRNLRWSYRALVGMAAAGRRGSVAREVVIRDNGDELRGADFNLSASRWRPQGREQIEHRDPLELVGGPQNGLYRPASDYGDGVRILRIDSFDDARISSIKITEAA